MRRLALTRLTFERRAARPDEYFAGDKCPDCGGRIGVYCTRPRGGAVTHYLKCRQCDFKPGNKLGSFR
jgi:hypothetical protein